MLEAREAPPIALVYKDGHEELFVGPLPTLIDRREIERAFSGLLPWTAPSGRIGLDSDETAAYLEKVAEWQP